MFKNVKNPKDKKSQQEKKSQRPSKILAKINKRKTEKVIKNITEGEKTPEIKEEYEDNTVDGESDYESLWSESGQNECTFGWEDWEGSIAHSFKIGGSKTTIED